ncbi:MAG: hypothetical protein ABIK09_08370 [Pseudomonadota bacterium]
MKAEGPRDYRLLVSKRNTRLVSASGKTLLEFNPAPVVQSFQAESQASSPKADDPGTLRWEFSANEKKQRISAEASNKLCRLEQDVRLQPDTGVVRVETEVRYRDDFLVEREVLALHVGDVGKALVVGRDQQVHLITGPYRIDPWTYKLLFFGSGEDAFALDVGFGVQSILVTPADDGGYRVELELDHAANHPFEVYERCHEETSTKHAKHSLAQTRRRKGEAAVHAFRILVGDVSPLRISRLPYGYRAALSFTDHADQSSLEKMKTLLFGSSDADPSHPKGGFIGYGLGLTKTVFSITRGGYSPQADTEVYIDALKAATWRVRSFDVGSHSPSGLRDRPKDTKPLKDLAALAASSAVDGQPKGLVWIDHQPDTNCEAMTNLGWDPESDWFILDRLVEIGFRYFWAGIDLDLDSGQLNLLIPERIGSRANILFRNSRFTGSTGDIGLYLWTSVWTFVKGTRFYAMFDDEALDRLVVEDGIHLGHSYLDSHRTRGRYVDRSHFVADKRKTLRMGNDMDALLLRLRERQEAGLLWVTGVAALFDHMTRLPEVEIRYEQDGTARVVNGTDRVIQGLTFFLPRTGNRVQIGERLLPEGHQRTYGTRHFFWVDLLPGEEVPIRWIDPEDHPVPFLPGAQLRLETKTGR